VEGLADLKQDTGWSVPRGGRLPYRDTGHTLSQDGSTEYLDHLSRILPSRVFVYRKPPGELWQGKVEMVRAPLQRCHDECLLWQVDVDEVWSSATIEKVIHLFQENPKKTSAFFWCNFFVGPNAVVSTRHGYAQNPTLEWLRVWRYRPGDFWASHEPPRLMRARWGRAPVDVGRLCPLTHGETEAAGASFDHYAYATSNQVRFKEVYYGYRGLHQRWSRLQRDVRKRPPRPLAQYFPWVEDHTMVTTPEVMGLKPMARELRGKWNFRSSSRLAVSPLAGRQILLHENWMLAAEKGLGRARLLQVLKQWSKTGFSRYLRVLEGQKPGRAWLGLKSLRSSKARFFSGPLAGLFMERICRRHRIDLMVLGSENKPLLTKYLNMQFHKRHRFSCKGRGTSTLHRFIPDASGIKSAKLFRRLFVDALMR